MSSQAGAAGTPPPPAPAARYADILFVNAVLDSAGGNPKGRRVVVLTPDGGHSLVVNTIVVSTYGRITWIIRYYCRYLHLIPVLGIARILAAWKHPNIHIFLNINTVR